MPRTVVLCAYTRWSRDLSEKHKRLAIEPLGGEGRTEFRRPVKGNSLNIGQLKLRCQFSAPAGVICDMSRSLSKRHPERLGITPVLWAAAASIEPTSVSERALKSPVAHSGLSSLKRFIVG